MDGVSDGQFNRVVWALFWRYNLGAAVIGFIAGFVVSFAISFTWAAYAASNGTPSTPVPVSVGYFNNLASGLAGLAVSFFVLKWVLRRLDGKSIAGAAMRFEPADAQSKDHE
jgi:hypothetical protein